MFKSSEVIIKNLINGVVLKYKGKELLKYYSVLDNKLKYIVVGTGRCGTVYMAKLLTSVGIPCGHECIFDHEGIDTAKNRLLGNAPIQMSLISKLGHYQEEMKGEKWLGDYKHVVAESSYMAAPFLQNECLKDAKIIHVIRDPVKVINSFVYGFQYFDFKTLNKVSVKPYHKFIFNSIPELNNDKLDPISLCALYWVRWNQMIENLSKDKEYFLQPIEKPLDNLFEFLNIKNVKNYYSNSESNHKNGLREKFNNIKQIPDEKIRNLVIGYAKKFKYIRNILFNFTFLQHNH